MDHIKSKEVVVAIKCDGCKEFFHFVMKTADANAVYKEGSDPNELHYLKANDISMLARKMCLKCWAKF